MRSDESIVTKDGRMITKITAGDTGGGDARMKRIALGILLLVTWLAIMALLVHFKPMC